MVRYPPCALKESFDKFYSASHIKGMNDYNLPVELSVRRLAGSFSFLKNNVWGIGILTLEEVLEKLKYDLSVLPKRHDCIKEVQCSKNLSQYDFQKPESMKDWEYFEERELRAFRDYHVKRIAYLVLNPARDAISVDVGVPQMGCFPTWPIDDGNHRLAAAIVRGDRTIFASFSGEHSEIKKFIKRYSTIPSKKILTKSV